MKKFFTMAMAMTLTMGMLSGCGGAKDGGDGADGAASYTWKMALNSTEGDNAYDTGAAFKEKIEELTNGQVTVELYGGASLGSTSEVLEGMSYGVADVMVESVGTLATFTPVANIEAAPFLINDYDHFMAVWQGDVGRELKEAVGDAAGFKLFGGTFRGLRIVTATKAMTTIDDFKGFKLRAPNLEMYLETWNWMKAAPTPLAMNEVYTALQQHTVDGQENPMVDSLNYAFDEVCKYWIKTDHVFGANVVIMDADYFAGLPEDIQKAVEEAADYAAQKVSAEQLIKIEEAEARLLEKGCEIIEIDHAAFASYYDNFIEEKFPDLKDWADKIKAAAPQN